MRGRDPVILERDKELATLAAAIAGAGAARRADDPLQDLTTREREVLALMAEGRSNAGIARHLWVAEGTVEKHVRSIMMKLHLAETTDDHRRVLAVLVFLDARLVAFGSIAQHGADSRC
jgi:DNA-binding NarL/FixJ family response regulator